MDISVCIPTCGRPEWLRLALLSCLNQSRPPSEVLIGDDSLTDETEVAIANLDHPARERVRYIRNQPPLGQHRNIHNLIQQCRGAAIALLHDDDLFEPDALALLAPCLLDPGIVAAFGRQIVITEAGDPDARGTEALNRAFHRNHSARGKQPNGLISALVQQFPNDGYLVRADAAKTVGYLAAGAYGDACDFAFGVLLANAGYGTFYFVDRPVARYRVTRRSVSRANPSDNTALMGFQLALRFADHFQHDARLDSWMKDKARPAIWQAARHGRRYLGLTWYFGRHHRQHILSLGGLKRLLMLLAPPWMVRPPREPPHMRAVQSVPPSR